jgi:hypothetical protein
MRNTKILSLNLKESYYVENLIASDVITLNCVFECLYNTVRKFEVESSDSEYLVQELFEITVKILVPSQTPDKPKPVLINRDVPCTEGEG